MPKSVPSLPNPVRSQFSSGNEDQPVFDDYDLRVSGWKKFSKSEPNYPILGTPVKRATTGFDYIGGAPPS
jgi:hypothetical protein